MDVRCSFLIARLDMYTSDVVSPVFLLLLLLLIIDDGEMNRGESDCISAHLEILPVD